MTCKMFERWMKEFLKLLMWSFCDTECEVDTGNIFLVEQVEYKQVDIHTFSSTKTYYRKFIEKYNNKMCHHVLIWFIISQVNRRDKKKSYNFYLLNIRERSFFFRCKFRNYFFQGKNSNYLVNGSSILQPHSVSRFPLK